MKLTNKEVKGLDERIKIMDELFITNKDAQRICDSMNKRRKVWKIKFKKIKGKRVWFQEKEK